MKDKKLLIIISTITLLLILLIIILLINNSNSKLKSEITTYNNVTIESTTTTSLTNSTGILNENNPGGGDHGGGATTTIVGTTSTTTKSTTSKITTSITSTTRNISYTCPDGYVLNGAICTSTMDAKYACSENTTDYSNEDIPKNTYCVNLSEAYDKPESGCPDNTGEISVLSFGAPTKSKCLPLHKKGYICEEGYSLNNTTCSKTIPATLK